jgi:ubiquinone biosynthesis O-methyltransferase
LDVGCGGGLLAEEFARLGCAVTGIDPSHESLAVAREHAHRQGLRIEYTQASGETLPFGDRRFEVAYCCDVLEHGDDAEQIISEIARVLAPGGGFLYDTINRTWSSKLLMIKLAQDWKATAWAEPGLHDFAMFIRPQEFEAYIKKASLDVRDRIGFAPANRATAFKALWDRAHGKITYAELGARLQIQESRDTSSSYGGYAVKPAY